MLKNYIKIALRNIFKDKFISGINLFGLTVGITCCLLILAYIVHELSFDKSNPDASNTYRVERTFFNPETKEKSLELGTVAPPFAPLLINDFKEIKKLTRLLPNGNTSFKYEDNMFYETDVYFADENLFDVFKVNVLKGNSDKSLDEPYSVMLSKRIAEKYFKNDDPMNKMVKLDNQLTCRVTGVFDAFASNSHIHPSVLISFNTLKDSAVYGERNLRTNWGNNSFFTYIQLPADLDPKILEAQFPAFQNRHILDNGDGKFKPSDWSKLSLKKLTDIHLYSHTDLEAEENGDIARIYIFGAIALFVLLIACINYMNLSTARSVLRAKEIGVRKVVGATRKELISQFLSESVLMSWIATVLAIGLTWITLPVLNKFSGQDLNINVLFAWEIVVPVLLVPFIVGLVAGIYPALFLSSFQPIKIIKGVMNVGDATFSFRRILVVVQFAISIILIIATVIVFQQLRFIQNKSLGYNKNHLVNLNYTASLNDSYESFKTELLSNNQIQSVARSSRIPTGRLLDAMGSAISNGDSIAPSKADIKYVVVDEGFMPTYGIRTVEGRAFAAGTTQDTSGFLINEAAVKALGIASNAKAIDMQMRYGNRVGKIIGVVNDFHFESLHQRILPLVFFKPIGNGNLGNLSIRIAGNDIPAALSHLETTWKKFLPETPFDYSFFDSRFDALYDSEQKQGGIFSIFSGIAILIACLGLFGLSAFSISQRIKEIGIRKVLGASIQSIVALLSKDFLKLVIIAAIIAFPVAWYAMDNWLQDFAYRINISWWIFIAAGIIAAIIAFATISIQTVKAAGSNPVKSLRSE